MEKGVSAFLALVFLAMAGLGADHKETKDTAYWYKKYGRNYGVEYGRVVKAGSNGVERLSGSVMDVVDNKRLLVSNGSTIKALLAPRTDRVVDGDYISCLVREAGVYEYTTVLWATKRVRQYQYIRGLTFAEFRKLGEQYFFEIAAERAKDEAEAKALKRMRGR